MVYVPWVMYSPRLLLPSRDATNSHCSTATCCPFVDNSNAVRTRCLHNSQIEMELVQQSIRVVAVSLWPCPLGSCWIILILKNERMCRGEASAFERVSISQLHWISSSTIWERSVVRQAFPLLRPHSTSCSFLQDSPAAYHSWASAVALWKALEKHG